MWATLIHLGGLFFGFIAPLIGYLVLKDRGPFVRAHTATALNFQLTLLIVYVAGYILTFVIVGIFVLIAAGILALVFSIIAAVKANQGQWYQYPMTIRFVS
ncbi:membrane protein [Microbacterium thalassium]|nr:membrane protein [Microbacterium thalassium]